MRKELSRRFFIAEAIVLGVPLTALLIFAIPSFSIPGRGQLWPVGAIDLVIVLATAATASGWRLLIAAIRGGAEALRKTHRAWWLTASLGCVLVLTGFVSMFLPPSPEYTPAAAFREYLDPCALGLPLVIVLIHLWAEARLRSSTMRVGFYGKTQ